MMCVERARSASSRQWTNEEFGVDGKGEMVIDRDGKVHSILRILIRFLFRKFGGGLVLNELGLELYIIILHR